MVTTEAIEILGEDRVTEAGLGVSTAKLMVITQENAEMQSMRNSTNLR